MERKEISEQIGELNLKIYSANKELEENYGNIVRLYNSQIPIAIKTA